MSNKSQAKILRDVKRITKFLSKKKPILSIAFTNVINLPLKPKPVLGFSNVMSIDVPPAPQNNSIDIVESIKKENEELKNDINVLRFILESYKQDENEDEDEEPNTQENVKYELENDHSVPVEACYRRQHSYECEYCFFVDESFERMKMHRRNYHNEDFSIL